MGMRTRPVSLKHQFRKATHSFFVTHDGIFDVSSLLNAAPCHTGTAHPRRATTARVPRHRASVDPLRLPQGSPPRLGSTAQESTTEVREALELYRLDLDRERSLWPQDRVARTRKSLRKRGVATTGSTISCLPECADESSIRDEEVSISLWTGANKVEVFPNVLVGTSI